jgi:HD-like signal output (HDOD) protein
MTNADERRQQAVEELVRRTPQLATFPAVALDVSRVVENPRAGAAALLAVIAQDQVLSTRVLRVSNTALFGCAGRIDSLDRAVFVLGFQAVRNIAIAASLSTLFRGKRLTAQVSLQDFWTHALAVGTAASLLEHVAKTNAASDAFLAGLVHDIGITAELQFDRRRLADIIERCSADATLDFIQEEEAAFGATHQDFGAALLEQWRLPPDLVVVAGRHHDPLSAEEAVRPLACLVHVADWMATQRELGLTLDVRPGGELDPAVLACLGVTLEDVASAASELPVAVSEMVSTLPIPDSGRG